MITLDLQKAQKHDAIQDFKKLLKKLSYYNAAESSDYGKEANARAECRKKLRMAGLRLLQHDVNPDEIIAQGSYLVDSWQ